MRISQCRLCSSDHIEKVVDLGFHPLADTFLPAETLYAHGEARFPLQLALCNDCGHVFTMFSVSPEDRYQKTDYSYDSSNSSVSISHFHEFANAVLKERDFIPSSHIVDIGSNVGTLLGHFKNAGFQNVTGVEPSENISRIAEKNGIKTINDFFCDRVIDLILADGRVDGLLSANVLNHADDLEALFRVAKAVLSVDGIFVFEVPYLLDLLESTAFDTIYHEHVHYHSIKPLAAALERYGFSIFKVERQDYMCGSIRVFCRVGTGHGEIVTSMITKENNASLSDLSRWRAFMDDVRSVKATVLANLTEISRAGGVVIGIGAATKGNTFLNYCGLDGDTIKFITDSSPLKIGKVTPGSHIPIVSDGDIDQTVTHALILPWNIADMLIKKLGHLKLTFYVPQVKTSKGDKNVSY